MTRKKRGGRGRGGSGNRGNEGGGGGGDGGQAPRREREPEPQTWEVRSDAPKGGGGGNRQGGGRRKGAQQPQRKKGQPQKQSRRKGAQQPQRRRDEGVEGGRRRPDRGRAHDRRRQRDRGRRRDRRGEPEGPAPIRVTDGVRAERGGRSWWSRKWVSALEVMGFAGRLERGRDYAREGQVLGFHVVPGIVVARVQGSVPKPYETAMKFQTLTDEEWERVYDAMSSRAAFAASLLAGEMPAEIEDAYRGMRVPLFPKPGGQDMEMLCSCPDQVKPCKHVAAVHYVLAEALDKDPFLLFLLRGKNREAVIEGLRRRRAATVQTGAGGDAEPEREGDAGDAVASPIPSDPSAYWRAGPELLHAHVRMEAPSRPHAIAHRLGRPAFWPEAVDYELWARTLYAAVSRRAMIMALGEADAEAGEADAAGGDPDADADADE